MKILFVCTGNTCRSPMAEGILRDLALKENLKIGVDSAGVGAIPGDRAAQHAIRAMDGIGINISGHISSQVSRQMVEEADLILTMGDSHRRLIVAEFDKAVEKTFSLIDYVYGEKRDVADPFGGSLALYERTRDEIYRAIERLVKDKL